ncbi:MAG: SLC13 family permease [Pedobacter sp.]
MTGAAIFTLVIVCMMLITLAFEILAPDIIVFSALGLLLLGDVLSPSEAFAGFSNPGMLTVGLLFIVAYAAQSSGILSFFADRVMGQSGGGRRSLVRMMTPVFGMSAFLNNTPIVAMFTPTIRDWALKHRFSPSKFLIPLSYASIFGGICTLIGTSTNLVVNGMLYQATQLSFGMFELAWVGLPCAVAGIAFMLLFGFRLLPERKDLAENIQNGAGREYFLEMKVQAGSSLAGKTVEEAGLRNLGQLYLAQILRNGNLVAPVRPTDVLQARDQLFFTGRVDSILRLHNIPGLVPGHEKEFCLALRNSGKGRILEAVVSRSSPMLGRTIKEGNFRARYDAAILAVHRHGECLTDNLGKIVLRPGDTLLLLAGDDFVKRWNYSREFYMVSKVVDIPKVFRRKSIISIAVLAGMVVLSASGTLDILKAAILSAIILIVTKCVTVVEARRSIELNVLIVIAAALGISRALEKTGAAGYLAGYVIETVQNWGPLGLLAAVYLVTSLLTELITNNAAAALIFPIAMAVAEKQGLNPMPFAVAIAVAASASFATPIGYQTNLMVYGPGGYKFTDFLKLGIPLNLIFMTVALIVIPRVWGF